MPLSNHISPPYAITYDAMFSYEISRKAEGNLLRLDRRLAFEKYLIPTDSYSAIRLFYDSVRAGDEEQIVLKATAPGKN